EWRGFIPWEAMPHVLDPPAGFLATANHKVVGDDYPYPLTMDWPPPDRARRINALLAADRRVSREAMAAMQKDTLLPLAGELRRYLAAVRPKSPLESAALRRIAAWNLRFEPGEVGPSIYEAWLLFLLPDIFGKQMGPALAKSASPLVYAQTDMLVHLLARNDDPLFDDRTTPRVETRDDVVRQSFSRAVAWLSGRLGDDPGEWRWSRLHTVSFAHQPFGSSGIAPLSWIFNSKTLPVAGEDSTVDSTGSDPDQPFRVVFGVSQRFIADLGDLSRSLAVNSTGQSGHPFHRHHEDQAALWARGEYHPMFTTREALAGLSEGVLTLAPPAPPRGAGR
nr:penicillin acylase family protein [Acidobacteriota bacterium]